MYALYYILFFTSAFSAELPSFIKKCSKSSPDLNDCITKQIPKVIEGLKDGDKELGLVPLEPLKVSKVEYDVLNEFMNGSKLILTDFNVDGLTNVHVQVSVDPVNDKTELSLHFPKLLIKGNYELKGTVNTKGSTDLDFGDITVDLVVHFDRVTVDQEEYYKISPADFSADVDIQQHKLKFKSDVKDPSGLDEMFIHMADNYFDMAMDIMRNDIATMIRVMMEKFLQPLLLKIPIANLYEK